MSTQKLFRQRLSYIIAIIPFAATAIDALDKGLVLLAAINFLAVLLNVGALYYSRRNPQLINSILFLLNSLIAFIVSDYFFAENKKVLPYVWLIVGILYLIIAVNSWLKSKSNKD